MQNLPIWALRIDFLREMLDTRHDDELTESMKNIFESDFEYLGALLYGPSDEVSLLTKSFRLWS